MPVEESERAHSLRRLTVADLMIDDNLTSPHQPRSYDSMSQQRWWALAYEELHGIAHRALAGCQRGAMIQTTAILHEAYFRFAGQHRSSWRNKAHFMSIAATLIRRALIDWIRRENRAKRGGRVVILTLEAADDVERPCSSNLIELIALDEALEALGQQSPRLAQIVELRVFAGLEIGEVAEIVGVSTRTVNKDWRFAKSWLMCQLSDKDDSPAV